MKDSNNPGSKLKIVSAITAIPAACVWGIARLVYNATFEKRNIIKIHAVEMSEEWKHNIDECNAWVLDNIENTLETDAYDGIKLKAYELKCPNPERVVLSFEGWRTNTPGVLSPLDKSLAEQGCRMILVANRAGEASGGDQVGMGMLEKHDVRSWVDYCSGHYPDLPLYLVGVSMGCASILLGAVESWNDKVSGIIADCGFIRPYDQVKDTIRNTMHLPGHLIMKITNRMVRRRMNEDMQTNDTLQTINNCRVPILFVHGTGDEFISSECSKENYEAYEGTKKLLLIDGAGHAECYQIGTSEYEESIRWLFDAPGKQ